MPSLGEHCSILLPTTARSPIIQVSFMHNLTLSLFSLQALVHISNFSRCRLSKALVHPPSYSTTARQIPSVAGYWSTISSLIVSNVLLLLYFFQAPSSSSKFYLLLFSRCRFSASTLPSSLLLNNNRPIPSVAVQPPVSEHRPTEGKEGEDTDRAKLSTTDWKKKTKRR